MFIESLTPEQLALLLQYLLFSAAIGGFLGSIAGPLFECFTSFVGWGFGALFGPKKSELQVIADLRLQRRLFLTRARTAGRELRKCERRQTLGRYAN